MRRLWPIATILVLAGAVAWSAARPLGADEVRGKQRPAVVIEGNVAGLYPGAGERLRLTLRNRSRRVAIVRRVGARVGDAGPGCPRSYLKTKARHLRLHMPAHSVRRVGLPTRLRAAAPDACQQVGFPLRYRARVVRR